MTKTSPENLTENLAENLTETPDFIKNMEKAMSSPIDISESAVRFAGNSAEIKDDRELEKPKSQAVIMV